MNESQFRSKLLQTFNDAHAPRSFIWAHDAHFRSGFPDTYWMVQSSPKPHHAELKVCHEKKLPADLMSLCTPIQRHIMKKLAQTEARVYLIVLHEPDKNKSGSRTVFMLPLHADEREASYSFDEFFKFWLRYPNMTFRA